MRSFALTTVLIFLTLLLYGQEERKMLKHAKWQIRPSAGVYFPMTKLANSTITDNLINTSDRPSFYLQPLACTYFFNNRWGIELTVLATLSGYNASLNDRFIKNLNRQYGEAYYVLDEGFSYSSSEAFFKPY